MNRVSINRSSGLWALDAALLLLGLMVLLLVLRLLRFDDPNPLQNAWIYVLGVPTCLVATSMITRVLANDFIEKSIQLGFLLSVGLHLFFMLFAVNMVLFSSYWPSEMQKLNVVPVSQKLTSPQYFQPASSNESRPDYLKPVKTEQNVAQEDRDLLPQSDESAKLNIDLIKDEIKPTLSEKPFVKPRKEASPSQPTITSTAEKLDRPDPNKNLDRQEQVIDVPRLKSSQPTPSQVLAAAAMDMERAETPMHNRNTISEMPPASLEIESRANQGSQQGIRKSTKTRDEKSTNRELEKALNRTAIALPDRPSLLKRGGRDAASDKPMAVDVPVPKLGATSTKTDSDSLSERNTEVNSRSNSSMGSTIRNVEISDFSAASKLDPNLGRASLKAFPSAKIRSESSASLSDSSFLSDPRLACHKKRLLKTR